jgi:5-(carboxyamino)imidazole ribonucleotide synthase
MGMRVRTLSPSESGPVADLGEAMTGDWTDPDVMRRFGEGCDAITVESEWAPAEVAADVFGDSIPVRPGAPTLHVIRHKGRQKSALRDAGIAVPAFETPENLSAAVDLLYEWDGRVVAKKFEGSYDGYGNATVTTRDEMEAAWDDLAAEDGLLVERFLPFRRELAVMVVRSPSGETRTYPVVETEQKDHRCHAVTAPARIPDDMADEAARLAVACARCVDAVGVLGVELFEMPDGTLLVNELAPRPHNTGHYSIDACHASQFENHVRAVLDLPLGDPSLQVPTAVMINVLGRRPGSVRTDGYRDALSVPGAAVHLYGKREARPKRKMGHVTVTGDDPERAREHAERAANLIHL